MSSRPANELLYDSEAALRLVDTALNELHGAAPVAVAAAAPEAPARRPEGEHGLLALQQMLIKASVEISTVLSALRECRSILERASVEKLQHTKSKLAEVSSATEVAAIDIINSIERSLGLVDELDACDGDAAKPAELRGQLRDELFGVMSSLQFQDITTQQLSYVSSVLAELEKRVAQVATAFDPHTLGQPRATEAAPSAAPATFDPAATTADAEQRQALVDALFGGK